MDISKLITLIESRSPIWDSSDPLHANRDAVKKLWDEIQVEMKVADCEVLKNKWRGLRENFRKELARERTVTGQGAGENTSKWRYFQSLTFLRGRYTPRAASGNFVPTPTSSQPPSQMSATSSESLLRARSPPLYTPSTSSQVLPTPRANIAALFAESPPDESQMSPHGVDEELEIAALEHGYASQAGPSSSTGQRRSEETIASKRRKVMESFIDIQRETLEAFRKDRSEKDDPDMQFLQSLWPSLKAVPEGRKSAVKMKLLGVLAEDEARRQENE